MDWMISNVALKRDAAGNIKPDKERSTGRIDGVVASVMSVGMAYRNTRQPEASIHFLGFGGAA
jgi:phage terminase large subunit-like protein